uniref:Uncharacterized protein ycf33 n=1 Tax=Rhodymenia pseudopalmata TaxID=31502 RepID=A0A1C9C7U4_RHOPU|nr:hypothetical protein Rhodyp_163 [Rhodymenia pseudopalmata]AOM64441.1 hypothetical protein Rhodyp_163 [Rhodymenia pseudopalmata]
MNSFWNNINRFPRFLLSVLLGFFLTTFYRIFRLLNNKKSKIIFSTIVALISVCLYKIIKLMTGLE